MLSPIWTRKTLWLLVWGLYAVRAQAAPLPRESNWVGEDTTPELALKRARDSIPAGWVEEPRRFSPFLLCLNPDDYVVEVHPGETLRCVDRAGRTSLARAVIPILNLQ